jgi:hypothetical protein
MELEIDINHQYEIGIYSVVGGIRLKGRFKDDITIKSLRNPLPLPCLYIPTTPTFSTSTQQENKNHTQSCHGLTAVRQAIL